MTEKQSLCLRPVEIAAYVSGRLSEANAQSLELHVHQCGECRQSLALALRDGSGDQVGELLNLVAAEVPGGVVGDASAADSSEMFSRYRLMRVLGRGGTAIVWEAWDCVMRRSVAVKHLLAEKSAWQESRFLQEASVLARLSHPNIVSVYELAYHHGRLAIVMEHVPGVNLAKFLRGSPVAEREAILLLNSLCAAVSHAHLQGVIHRDLKPSNVLLSWQGQPESAARKLSNATIKITDFGLARVIDASQQTEAGQRVGTPGYMSPEQVAGDVAATGERTDVYGLGAILYELLVGRPPFVAEDPLVTMSLIRERSPVAPRLLLPSISVDLEAICLKCLAKLPADRYGSVTELQADLESVLAGRPALLVMHTGWRRLRGWFLSHRLLTVCLVTTVLATAAVAWLMVRTVSLQRQLGQQAVQVQQAETEAQTARLRLQSELWTAMENWERSLSYLENTGLLRVFDKDSAERRQLLGAAAIQAFRAYFDNQAASVAYTAAELQAAMRFVDLLHTHSPEYSTAEELAKIAAGIEQQKQAGMSDGQVRELQIQYLYLHGRSQWGQQDRAGSAESFRLATELVHQTILELDADDPRRDLLLTNRASMLLDAANLYAQLPDAVKAASLMTTACEIHQQRLTEQPDSDERRLAVVRVQCAMATLLKNLHESAASVKQAEEALLSAGRITLRNPLLQPELTRLQVELQAIIDGQAAATGPGTSNAPAEPPQQQPANRQPLQ